MIFENDTTGENLTEQDVDYKVNSGTPPFPEGEPASGGPCDIFDDTWRRIYRGQPVGPCPPPNNPPWRTCFRVRGLELCINVENPTATVALVEDPQHPGYYSISVT
jgi:hypothetical protein